jgi:hypothetical protein
MLPLNLMPPRKPELHWIEKALGGRGKPAELKDEDENHQPSAWRARNNFKMH